MPSDPNRAPGIELKFPVHCRISAALGTGLMASLPFGQSLVDP